MAALWLPLPKVLQGLRRSPASPITQTTPQPATQTFNHSSNHPHTTIASTSANTRLARSVNVLIMGHLAEVEAGEEDGTIAAIVPSSLKSSASSLPQGMQSHSISHAIDPSISQVTGHSTDQVTGYSPSHLTSYLTDRSMITVLRLDPERQQVRYLLLPSATYISTPDPTGIQSVTQTTTQPATQPATPTFTQPVTEISPPAPIAPSPLLSKVSPGLAKLPNVLPSVTLDRVLHWDLNTVKTVVDRLGGVELWVEAGDLGTGSPSRSESLIRTVNPKTNPLPEAVLTEPSGWQLLDGKAVIEFLTADASLSAELDRQYQVFEALRRRLQQPAQRSQVAEVVRIAYDTIDTNLTLAELDAIVEFWLSQTDLQATVLPGRVVNSSALTQASSGDTLANVAQGFMAQGSMAQDPVNLVTSSQTDQTMNPQSWRSVSPMDLWQVDLKGRDRVVQQIFNLPEATSFISTTGSRTQIGAPRSNLRITMQAIEPTFSKIAPQITPQKSVQTVLQITANRLQTAGFPAPIRLAVQAPPQQSNRTQIVTPFGELAIARQAQFALGCGEIVVRPLRSLNVDLEINLAADCLSSPALQSSDF